ncbi:MAG: hypothetical protein IIB95_05290 [Candidatus Marinimicrobia bacterium]|nr:hypothetical protein [Candidatus Neomarinimicrobiota bacterium]
MIKFIQQFLPLLLLLPLFLNAQWYYTGSFHPVTMNRVSDFSTISLPFRIAELEVGFSKGDFDFKSNSAVEYRWTGGEAEFDLREAYLIWYPSWGEVKVGKQIHAWGAVDGNNPTDNLNPYDYYFMFLPGIDRKIGTLSASIKYYWNDWQLEAVVVPKHEGNRLPFDEPDFPIFQSTDYLDPRDHMKKVPSEIEFGFNIKTTLKNSDIGFSFFKGRDRGFSLGGYEYGDEPTINWPIISPEFCYRQTSIMGIDFVSFIGDFTLRGEGGYFQTENDYSYDFKNELKASYLQFALQLEYLTPIDLLLSGQLIGSDILSLEGLVYEQGWEIFSARDVTEDDFQTGMGTPFAMFTDLGMFLSTSGNFWDNTLEIRVNTFLDLEDSQTMLGGGVTYSPVENWEIDLSVSKFSGKEGTTFNEIEDFSHISFGANYRF